MEALLQAVKIVLEVQRKRSNVKITRRKISFSTYKTQLKVFILSNMITFLFFNHLKLFKVLYECHLKFYKSSLNSNNNIATYKDFFSAGGLFCWWAL
jgi:hypothetical protein